MELLNILTKMSDNYKVIRRSREHINELKAAGWSHGKIAKTIDVAHSMVGDILTIDEVALGLREATIKKLRKFNDTRAAALQFRQDLEEKVERKPEPPKEEVKKAPLLTFRTVNIKYATEDMLDVINFLAERFAEKGYRLDACLTKIHDPNEPEQKV